LRKLTRRQFTGTLGALTLSGMLRSHMSAAAQEPALKEHYDLIVVGIGSGGFGAACAAAQQGLKVLGVEKAGQIGGNAVTSGVTMWEPGVGGTGLPFQIYRRLKATRGRPPSTRSAAMPRGMGVRPSRAASTCRI